MKAHGTAFACTWANACVLLRHPLEPYCCTPCTLTSELHVDAHHIFRRQPGWTHSSKSLFSRRPPLPPSLPPSLPPQIRINFNITMLDVPCEFATVDILDVLGTNQQNVTKNIEKWNLDQNAQRRMFQG